MWLCILVYIYSDWNSSTIPLLGLAGCTSIPLFPSFHLPHCFFDGRPVRERYSIYPRCSSSCNVHVRMFVQVCEECTERTLGGCWLEVEIKNHSADYNGFNWFVFYVHTSHQCSNAFIIVWQLSFASTFNRGIMTFVFDWAFHQKVCQKLKILSVTLIMT